MLCSRSIFHLFGVNLHHVNMNQYVMLNWQARDCFLSFFCTRLDVSKIRGFFCCLLEVFVFVFFLFSGKGVLDLKFLGPIAREPSRRAAGSVSAYCQDSHYLEMLHNTALNPT